MAIKTKYWPFAGGLDLVTSGIEIDPGKVLGSRNYEIGIHSGYRRIEGYERFDGHDKPSDASYWILDFDASDTEVSADDTVTGVTSGSTGIALIDGVLESGTYVGGDAAGYLVLYDVSDDFEDDEVLNVSASPVATAAAASYERAADTTALDTTYYRAAVSATRDGISAVPGSGIMRGVWIYKGIKYAFRDNAGGTAGDMYKSTASGWSKCSLGGSTLTAGGSYEFINYNFTGASVTQKMYGVNGLDKAFQWDGTTFTYLATGMTVDTPDHVSAKDFQLILSFPGGNLQASGIGDPTSWTLRTGADQVGVGDEITGMKVTVGNVLTVFARNSTYTLAGATSTNWEMSNHSTTSGAIAGTVQQAQGTIYLDDRGLTSLTSTDGFGDFQANTLSKLVQPRFDIQKSKVTTSVLVRSKNQYILFFDDETAIEATFDNEKVIGFMDLGYDLVVRCAVSGEDTSGNEEVFIGSDDGYIYQLNKGTSFDGDEIGAFLRTAYNHMGSPQHWKRFRRITLEMGAGLDPTIDLEFAPEFSYSDPDIPTPTIETYDVKGGGGFWNSSIWNQFYWSGQAIGSLSGHLDGIGYNMGLLINSNVTHEKPHSIHGAVIHYSVKGMVR